MATCNWLVTGGTRVRFMDEPSRRTKSIKFWSNQIIAIRLNFSVYLSCFTFVQYFTRQLFAHQIKNTPPELQTITLPRTNRRVLEPGDSQGRKGYVLTRLFKGLSRQLHIARLSHPLSIHCLLNIVQSTKMQPKRVLRKMASTGYFNNLRMIAITMSILLSMASVNPFSFTPLSSGRSMLKRAPTSNALRVSPSRSPRPFAAVTADVETENMPELGKDGIYKISNEAEHK